MPEISIIVPVYKAEKYISRCLDALIQQTFRDIEIICVDDGSPDNCPQILDDYAIKDSRIRVIHQQNAGTGAARNRGLDEAQGKYAMFCDNDDWYEPNMCEVMHQLIIDKKVDMVMCNPFMELQGLKIPKISLATVGSIPGGLYKTINRYFPTTSGLVWNKIFRMDLIRQYNPRFGVCHGEDLVFGREYMFVIKSFYCLNRNLYHYIMRGSSQSAGATKSCQSTDLIDKFTITYDFLVRHGLLEQHKKLLIYTFLGQARKNLMATEKIQWGNILDAMRTFINHVNFSSKDWGNKYIQNMIMAIQNHQDEKGIKYLYWLLYVCPAYGIEYFKLIVYRLFWSSAVMREYKESTEE